MNGIGLKKQVERLGWGVVGLSLIVIALGGLILVDKAEDAERVERWVAAGGWVNERGTPIPKPVMEASHGWEIIRSDDGVAEDVPKHPHNKKKCLCVECFHAGFVAEHGQKALDDATAIGTPKIGGLDDIAMASLSNYASLETKRIAKMAEMMMGMGGEYTARCEAVYNSVTDKVETQYSITWYRKVGQKVEDDTIVVEGERPIIETWTGANWGECINKMMAWRGGN